MAQEFVHIAADGVEVDWIDPYEWHREIHPGVLAVSNGLHVYEVDLRGGCTYVIREMEADR